MARKEMISVRVDPSLKKKIEAQAKKEVRNFTDQVRKILFEAVKND